MCIFILLLLYFFLLLCRSPNESPPSSLHISHLFKHNHIASPIEQATSKLTSDTIVDSSKSHIQKRQTTFDDSASSMKRIRQIRNNHDSYEIDDEDENSVEDERRENGMDGNDDNNDDDDTDDGDDDSDAHKETDEKHYDEKDNHDRLDDTTNQHIPFWDPYDSVNQLYLQVGKCV